jgi:hypothetical protein
LRPTLFIDDVLSGWVLRTLDDDELDEYRRPFATTGEDRLPALEWVRQVPICGGPAEVVEVAAAYAGWLAEMPGLPKLFINAEPGAVLTGAQRDFCRTSPDQTEVTVPGLHSKKTPANRSGKPSPPGSTPSPRHRFGLSQHQTPRERAANFVSPAGRPDLRHHVKGIM